MPLKQRRAFHWYDDKPVGIRVTFDSGITSADAAYLVRNDDLHTRYFELPNRVSCIGGSLTRPIAYTTLTKTGTQAQNLIIRLSDFIQRIDISTSRKVIEKDLEAGWFQCPLWDWDGNRVSQYDLVQTRRKIALVKRLVNPTADNSTRYGQLWSTYFKGALEEAEARLYMSHQVGGYDVLNRFFVPDATTFRLGFLPRQGFEIRHEDFNTINNKFKRSLGVDPARLDLPSEEAARAAGWIKFSEHPLGLYTTWIEQGSRSALQYAQAGAGGWGRWLPTTRQVKDFNKKLLAKSQAAGKVDSIRPVTIASLPRWQGESLSSFRRRVTATFMGESANKWAKQTLGWTGETSKSVVAGGFIESPIDSSRTPAIDTVTCAEATVTQLLSSDKIHQLLVETRSECAYKLGTMRYTRWATKKLEYTIKFQTLDSKRSVFMWKTNFFPFSRRYPFRFEYELDKIILERTLNGLDAPQDPTSNANRDILAPYDYSGGQGWNDQPVLCQDSRTWAGDTPEDDDDNNDDDEKDGDYSPSEGEEVDDYYTGE
ncbi:hypothetical protein FRC07_005614 [Ceratobasidium sp. 392]|nr:hypothetical protein FRC07_005614 [Ceratobasidium sp. 392]